MIDWFTRTAPPTVTVNRSVCWPIWCSSGSTISPTAPGCGRCGARAQYRPAETADSRLIADCPPHLHSDVLIIGAGSAGSVLAERLSADPACRVTVVEAGIGPADPGLRTQTANGLRLPIGPPAHSCADIGRSLPTPAASSTIIRGVTVGGSGAVNGGYFCRGWPRTSTVALPGWSWADVIGHFRAIETDLDFTGPAT